MFGLGHWELLIILAIVIIIFGAGKLPQIGAGMGQGIRNFKKGIKEIEKEETEKIEVSKTPP
jgi:sec-independent protein translocase protein TatA